MRNELRDLLRSRTDRPVVSIAPLELEGYATRQIPKGASPD